MSASRKKCVEHRASVDARGDLEVGASIALDGVCLTVVAFDQDRVVDLIGSTLSTTTLGSLIAGQQVNVERAARFGDEIGGHELSGHISTTRHGRGRHRR